MSSRSTDEAVRADIVRALDAVLGEVRLAVQDWRADARARQRHASPNSKPIRRRCRWTKSPRRSSFCNGCWPTISLSSACAITPSTARRWSRISTARSASCARANCACSSSGNELLEYTPEIMAFLKEPRLLIIAKANIHAHVHRRVYLDYIGIKRFDASGNLVGEQRIVGLFTSTAYTRTAHSIPYLRRKIAGVEQRAGFDRQQPFRQGAGERARALSARRIVPDRRGVALSFRARDPATRRAAARARAGAARPLRPFRLGAGVTCRANATTAISARGSASISRALSSGASRRSIRSSRKARWCACTSSSAAPVAMRPRSTRRHWSARSAPSCARGATG